jgi:hypothetical protein
MVITTSPVHIKHPPKIWFNRGWVHIFGAIRWECLILDGILWGWYTNFQKVHVIQITTPNFFSWFFEVEMLILQSALSQQFCWLTLAQCRPQKDKHWWDEPWPKTNPLIMIFVWNDRWPLGPICHTGQHIPAKSHEKPLFINGVIYSFH